jgi:hypothetical protein
MVANAKWATNTATTRKPSTVTPRKPARSKTVRMRSANRIRTMKATGNRIRQHTIRNAFVRLIVDDAFTTNSESSNENKMSDGGRDRASLGVQVWKSSQKWSAQRSIVRSIAWLDLWRRTVKIMASPFGLPRTANRHERYPVCADCFRVGLEVGKTRRRIQESNA